MKKILLLTILSAITGTLWSASGVPTKSVTDVVKTGEFIETRAGYREELIEDPQYTYMGGGQPRYDWRKINLHGQGITILEGLPELIAVVKTNYEKRGGRIHNLALEIWLHTNQIKELRPEHFKGTEGCALVDIYLGSNPISYVAPGTFALSNLRQLLIGCKKLDPKIAAEIKAQARAASPKVQIDPYD